MNKVSFIGVNRLNACLKVALVLFSVSLFSCQTEKENSTSPNVLFIAIDDLRTELGCYGHPLVHSPNLDQIAKEGFLFKRHFVAVPTCGASRYSMLTGMLPQTKAHLKNQAIAEFISQQGEQERPESFVHQLRRNNYYTVGMGKIPHSADGLVYGYLEAPSETKEMPHSWDEFLFDFGKWGTGWNAFFGYADGSNRNDLKGQVKPYESADVPDEGYPDGLTANLAIKKLQELKDRQQPFFLGVGFFKPHLPFTAPKKYWDLYDEATLPLSPAPDLPMNVHMASLNNNGEFNNYALGDEKATLEASLSDAYSRKLTHGYYACISYIDAQVGRLVAELKRLDLDKNTIIVVWGDHGWQLGDHRMWGKHTIFEQALNSTFILQMPGQKSNAKVVNEIVSTVDIYPTILAACGIAQPHPTDGESLLPLLESAQTTNWRNTAYSYFRNGISVRTDRYRLSQYFREETPKIELYDHLNDPFEKENIAAEHPTVVEELMPVLQKGNTGLYD